MAATSFLTNLLMDANELLIETNNDEMDNFGRILGTLYIEGESVNEIMVRKGHAVREEYQ